MNELLPKKLKKWEKDIRAVVLAAFFLTICALLSWSDFQEMFRYRFMERAIYAGVLAALAFGIIGSYIVIRRLVFITGGIAHASFGGVGLAFYIAVVYLGWSTITDQGRIQDLVTLCTTIFALSAALGIGLLGRETLEREETTIGIIWAVGMALGAFFIQLTPGYAASASSYLFGDITLLRTEDIYLLLLLILLILTTTVLLFHKMQALAFDEEFTMVSGVHTTLLNLYFLCLVSMSIVLLLKFMGIILVLAMLTIPASIVGQFTKDLKRIMVWSTFLSFVFVMAGLWSSMEYETVVGATVVIQAAVVYLIVTFSRRAWAFIKEKRELKSNTSM